MWVKIFPLPQGTDSLLRSPLSPLLSEKEPNPGWELESWIQPTQPSLPWETLAYASVSSSGNQSPGASLVVLLACHRHGSDVQTLTLLQAPPPFWALGISVVSSPLVDCVQESFPADLGGRREGVTGLLTFNLDSWVYGRKHGRADAVIKAIPEAGGGRERSPLGGWFPHLPLSRRSQPWHFSRLLCLSSKALTPSCIPNNCPPKVT